MEKAVSLVLCACTLQGLLVVKGQNVSDANTTVAQTEMCNQEPDSGPCLIYVPQFFYNTTSGKCETFIYGGCGGNLNRFDSLTTCQMWCRGFPEVNSTEVCNQPPETGPCKAYVPQLYYNAELQMCMPFIYGGCDGNCNRFESLQMCLKTCHPEGSDVVIHLLSQDNPAFKSADVCHLPMDAGPCKVYVPRYFYNSTSQRCEGFIYGGCKGNGNNFHSKRSCILNCPEGRDEVFTSKSSEVCSLPPETGPCEAAVQRYYYDPASNGCRLFIYGGCDGNQNNFVNEKACLKHCKNKQNGL